MERKKKEKQAYNCVFKQYNDSKNNIVIPLNDDEYEVSDSRATSDHKYLTTNKKCSCTYQNRMQLPCRHIFSVRIHKCHNLFDETLCGERWSQKYYIKYHRMFHKDIEERCYPNFENECENVLSPVLSSLQRNKPMTQHEKFKQAAILTTVLAQLVSEECNEEFEFRLNLLRNLSKFWKLGKKVTLHEVIGMGCKTGNLTENAELDIVEIERDYCNKSSEDHNFPINRYTNVENCFVFENIDINVAEEDLECEIITDISASHLKNVEIFKEDVEEARENPSLAFQQKLNTDSHFRDITMPLPIKRGKGRPKGHLLTVIGLTKKKKS
ncbi:unnamed protein product [Psylliodes chrysocephalus]|uniref:SWIM-type domain-containing protein n=1 Tax=Psylliodes chrysocephalus TaxID=3402493 RepID=A0A9P0DCB8_9CUCU|nr:unnamed protein product [Psylliodes chrysocephala]